MKKIIAVPSNNGILFQHFGRSPFFSIFQTEEGNIVKSDVFEGPEHDHALQAQFFQSHGVQTVIAGGMGPHAQQMLKSIGVEFHVGAPNIAAADVVKQFLAGTLTLGQNTCSGHEHGHEHGHTHGHEHAANQPESVLNGGSFSFGSLKLGE